MVKHKEYFNFILTGFICLLITYFSFPVISAKLLQAVNDPATHYSYFLSRRYIKPFKIIGIPIDEYSLRKIPQRWPWKRSIYAQLLKILDKEKVNTIGIDFTFVGEAEDKGDDLLLRETIDAISSRVVLAYFFDYKKVEPVLPLKSLTDAAYAIGMVNTPQDPDGKTRRLRSFVELGGNFYYSFSVQLAVSFLNKNPGEIISSIPVLKDKTFFINFLLKPRDVIRISFCDALENLEEVKQQYGRDFLKDSLVLVYPEAGIFHDMQPTPLGNMPGGFLHLNGAADIISGRFLEEKNILLLPFLVFSFAVIAYILLYCGVIAGLLFTVGVLFLNFWFFVLLTLAGIRFDFSGVVFFGILFFVAGSLYKYLSSLTALLRIKNKATIDPVRGLFTLRYFYYRLELETRKIYLRKELFLVFLHLESFKEAIADVPLERLKNIWQRIQSIVSLKESFWSIYSDEEVVGGIACSRFKIGQIAGFLKNNLQEHLSEEGIKSNIRVGYIKVKREYPPKELVFVISSELKKKKEDIVLFSENDFAAITLHPHLKTKDEAKLLESLDEDIEERNRELLLLIGELEKEHAKTKEAFFQIIGSLVNALEARDPYTEGHSQRVCNYSVMMVEKLGWPKEERDKLAKAALLHDLGKIGVPDSILHKKGQLNEEEFDFIKKHELIGVKILEPLKDFHDILPWIMYHHERWDGKGYPHGLAGVAIPQASQIIALADVYDALTTGRDYKEAFSSSYAIDELLNSKGTRFNPELVDLFVELIQHRLNP